MSPLQKADLRGAKKLLWVYPRSLFLLIGVIKPELLLKQQHNDKQQEQRVRLYPAVLCYDTKGKSTVVAGGVVTDDGYALSSGLGPFIRGISQCTCTSDRLPGLWSFDDWKCKDHYEIVHWCIKTIISIQAGVKWLNWSSTAIPRAC